MLIEETILGEYRLILDRGGDGKRAPGDAGVCDGETGFLLGTFSGGGVRKTLP